MPERYTDELKNLVESEYLYVRTEITALISEIRQLEKLAVWGSAVALAWLFSHLSAPVIAWFVPVGVTAFAGTRCYSLNESMKANAEYLRKREESIAQCLGELENPNSTKCRYFGWETYRQHLNSGTEEHAKYFWLFLLLVLLVPIGWRVCSAPMQSPEEATIVKIDCEKPKT